MFRKTYTHSPAKRVAAARILELEGEDLDPVKKKDIVQAAKELIIRVTGTKADIVRCALPAARDVQKTTDEETDDVFASQATMRFAERKVPQKIDQLQGFVEDFDITDNPLQVLSWSREMFDVAAELVQWTTIRTLIQGCAANADSKDYDVGDYEYWEDVIEKLEAHGSYLIHYIMSYSANSLSTQSTSPTRNLADEAENSARAKMVQELLRMGLHLNVNERL